MRRADRLFQIVQYLRGGRLTTAARLAEQLEVTKRTVYRDIADLIGSGVPIEGEAGVGYIMRDGYDVPPLMFTLDEISALVAGARLVRAYGGRAMAAAAEEALIKVEAVIPEEARARAASVGVYAIGTHMIDDAVRDRLDQIEAAVEARRLLHLGYADKDGTVTARDVRGLGLWFWGRAWTLVGWCELRQDFRMFRVDRIRSLEVGDRYKERRGQTLRDFYAVDAHRHPRAVG